uniref:hypothetical protein n=1 Tax=uncultured Caulobacter sp. TaxID=158749 RepID=UPI0025F175F3|nr:hypothetical protein [uncultured Caulobacter sp.]
MVALTLAGGAQAQAPIKVKVFVAAMFEIGENTGDRAGEFQPWYERYWRQSAPQAVKGGRAWRLRSWSART